MDHAHKLSTPENDLGDRLEDQRRRFEELLGNANWYELLRIPQTTIVLSEYFLKGEETLTRRNHGHLGVTMSEVFHFASWTIGLSAIPHKSWVLQEGGDDSYRRSCKAPSDIGVTRTSHHGGEVIHVNADTSSMQKRET